MKRASWLAVIGLMLSLLGAGCADRANSSDSTEHGGFYGGVSGGWTRP